MDFTLSERETYFRDRVRGFIDQNIRPRNHLYEEQSHEGERWKVIPVIEEMKVKAKEAGLWNFFMPPHSGQSHVDDSFEFEGTQLTNLEYALCAEEMGKIGWASECFNCSAPDTGNMEVLHRYGTREHKDRWLKPLMNGEIRSAFPDDRAGGCFSPMRPTSKRAWSATATIMSLTASNGGRRASAIRAARSRS